MTDPLAVFSRNMKVFGAPGRYLQGPGIINSVGACAALCGRSAVVVADRFVLPLFRDVLQQSLAESAVDSLFIPFDGALTSLTGGDLVRACGKFKPDTIVAVGGGRAIDAGKAIADLLQTALVTLPTAASNDAPTSKNYVLYDSDGRLSEVRHLKRSPDFVIVDTKILAGAPKHLFAAGPGDALSKKSEALACAAGQGTNMFMARPTNLAVSIASWSHEVLLQHGYEALNAAGTGEPSQHFEAAVEAMILMAGLGFESGGLSIPHALTRGLSRLPWMRTPIHGMEVAYGLVVHHELLGEQFDRRLAELYDHAGLPMSLQQLTGHVPTLTELQDAVSVTMSVRHVANFPWPIDATDLLAAMLNVEKKHAMARHSSS